MYFIAIYTLNLNEFKAINKIFQILIDFLSFKKGQTQIFVPASMYFIAINISVLNEFKTINKIFQILINNFLFFYLKAIPAS